MYHRPKHRPYAAVPIINAHPHSTLDHVHSIVRRRTAALQSLHWKSSCQTRCGSEWYIQSKRSGGYRIAICKDMTDLPLDTTSGDFGIHNGLKDDEIGTKTSTRAWTYTSYLYSMGMEDTMEKILRLQGLYSRRWTRISSLFFVAQGLALHRL